MKDHVAATEAILWLLAYIDKTSPRSFVSVNLVHTQVYNHKAQV